MEVEKLGMTGRWVETTARQSERASKSLSGPFFDLREWRVRQDKLSGPFDGEQLVCTVRQV